MFKPLKPRNFASEPAAGVFADLATQTAQFYLCAMTFNLQLHGRSDLF